MRKAFLILPVLLVSLLFACSSGQTENKNKKSDKTDAPAIINTQGQKLSYAIGFSVGQKIKTDNIDGLDMDILLKGLNDAIDNKDAAISDDEIKEAFMAHQQQQATKNAAQGEANLKLAEEFLKENETKEGIKTLEKGLLQYKVIKSGKGTKS
ncbi:FKBP-type peptidyl-prolyl cis-trans isomerase N-terminal domain-containing protein, partial [bacterium]|nr:FKBP-type peptidyl-prolyl cis-trans isomerase N-terminal domain-containing protein [bacterium]